MFFKQIIAKVELIVDGILPRIVPVVFVPHGLHYLILITGSCLRLLCRLIFETRCGIRENGIALLDGSKHLCGIGFFREIGMILLDEIKVGGLELLVSEVEWNVEQFVVVDCCSESIKNSPHEHAYYVE